MSTRHRNQRLAPELYEQAGQACFFTLCCAPGATPFADHRYAEIAVNCLVEQQLKSSCSLLVYCVMPDHLHAVIAPQRDGVSTLTYMDRFKGWTSRELKLAGWRRELWQRRSYDHLIRADEDLRSIAEYILANPVRAGLVTEASEYPWSGPADVKAHPRRAGL